MLGYEVLIVAVGFIAFLALAYVFVLRYRGKRPPSVDVARKTFTERREWLEADFLKIASNSGKPRGLRWVDCDFDGGVSMARDRKSGFLNAFVGVSIKFEAIEGGEMEDVEAVGNEKAATAVFEFNGEKWVATGKTVFNLNPIETIEFYGNELEPV